MVIRQVHHPQNTTASKKKAGRAKENNLQEKDDPHKKIRPTQSTNTSNKPEKKRSTQSTNTPQAILKIRSGQDKYAKGKFRESGQLFYSESSSNRKNSTTFG